MAKRRRLEAPSAADLDKIEEEFRRETPTRPQTGAAPIAQVAADAAAAYEPADPEARTALATLQTAREKGLLLLDLPLETINPDAMIRDRSMLEQSEMTELQISISTNGLRLPIEVFEMAGEGPQKYGLLSGYRRFRAVQALAEMRGPDDTTFRTIKAILRWPQADADRFAAMVEENEVRASLSHYERGRIAVIAAQQGAFANTEAAVDAMFPVASKSKRSKIRSFALIFEELGDLLVFAETIKEKDGLRLATALRQGGEARIREVLGTGQGTDPASEWALLDAAITEMDDVPKVNRGGRPRINVPKPGWHGTDVLQLSNGIRLRKDSDSDGYLIRLSGKELTSDLMDSLMEEIRYLLERPDK